MSSYHSKFTYLNKDSNKDLGWIIVHFEGDSGEQDSFLTQEQIFTDSYNGSRRILYGTKWTEVARPKITVIKQDGSGFGLDECREAYRWLTGNPNASWLDLYVGDELKYSFLCTVQDVKPEKLDARTVGMNIYFESVSPWAYSPTQIISYSFVQNLSVTNDGMLSMSSEDTTFKIDSNGVLYNSNEPQLTVSDDGAVYFDNTGVLEIDNQSDDLYSYVYLDVVFINNNCDSISIKNQTLNEETTIVDISPKEIINLSSNQFITSNKLNKVFGNTFNYIWPRLAPGINEFVVSSAGQEGYIELSYRYPIKAGDCAIDIDVSGNDLCCGGDSGDGSNNTAPATIAWKDITNKPTTRDGYNIRDVYTKTEVDRNINNAEPSVDETELNNMLTSILGK